MNNVNSVFPFIDELLMNDDGWRIMDHGPPREDHYHSMHMFGCIMHMV